MQQQKGKKFCGLASRLLELRGDATQLEFARSIGVIQQTYAHWELGVRQPKLQELIRLAQHFGVSTDWILGLTDVKAQLQNENINSDLLSRAILAEKELRRYKDAFQKTIRCHKMLAEIFEELQEAPK